MTRALYKENVYQKNAKGRITSIEYKDDSIMVTLDETIFFPTGGGQSHDLGTIGNHIIKDVYIYNGEIYHLLHHEGDILQVGDEIKQILDWEHRFDNMQRHCGEHILSGIFHRELQGINRGFHMGQDYMTIDIDLSHTQHERLTWEMAKKIELEANKVIWANLPVITTFYETKSAAENEKLRKELKLEHNITIVRIGNEDAPSDAVACCGTHPSHSGQVGLIKLYKIESNKGMWRIFFDAGQRAFKHLTTSYDLLTEVKLRYSASEDDLLTKMNAKEEREERLHEQLKEMSKNMIDIYYKKVSDDFTAHKSDNSNSIIHIVDELDVDNLQRLGLKLQKKFYGKVHPNILAIGSTVDKTMLIFALSDSADCSILASELRASGYKGGGSSKNARIIAATDSPFTELIDKINNK